MSASRRAKTTARFDDGELSELATRTKPEEERPTTALDPAAMRALVFAATPPPPPDDQDLATREVAPLDRPWPLETDSPVDPPEPPERVATGSSLDVPSFAAQPAAIVSTTVSTMKMPPLAYQALATAPTGALQVTMPVFPDRKLHAGMAVALTIVILALGGSIAWVLLT